MDLPAILNKISPLSEQAVAELASLAVEKSLQKGYIIFTAERFEPNVYFLSKGVVRAYTFQDEEEVTFWFGEEGEALLSMKSYVAQKPGYEEIELLEDCKLFQLDSAALHDLYQKDIEIANWGRRLAENELMKLEQRMIEREKLSAKQRYDNLLAHQSSLLQRVPLKYIASYLGITQVSLSRIRALR